VGNKNLLVLSFTAFDSKEKSTRFSNGAKTVEPCALGDSRLARARMSVVGLEAKGRGQAPSSERKNRNSRAAEVVACCPEG